MHVRRKSLTGVAIALLLGCPAVSLGGAPWNRDLEGFAAWPAGGGYRVYAAWTANTETTSMTRDLSTDVELRVNGVLRSVRTHEVLLFGGSGAGCTIAPCVGTCGQWALDGVQAPLLCYKDSPCSPSFCECDCGNWILTDLGIHSLVPGDDLSVLLRADAGALQDGDTTDDFLQAEFAGIPIGWDRRVDTITFREVARGKYDVSALGGVEWNVPSRFFSLDMVVELWIDGTFRDVLTVPIDIENEDGDRCATGSCSAPCGTVNGVPRVCDRTTRWNCACSGPWLATFEGVEIDDGAEVKVRIRSGPGAMPSLPDTDNDDVVLVPCCDLVDVAMVGVSWTALEANRPNPFTPSTTIGFVLTDPGPVTLRVVDAGGRRVATIVTRTYAAGRWTIRWDGRDDDGAEVPAGTYFYTLTTPRGSETRRMTLLR